MSETSALSPAAGNKAKPITDEVRDYSMFDAELSGAVLNMSLLGRILGWMKPYKAMFALSALLVLVWSTLHVMLPVIISVVVVDHILNSESQRLAPDLGLIEVTQWIASSLNVEPLFAACILYAVVQIAWAIVGHAHRQTLIASVINGLRDLRLDLFRHLETCLLYTSPSPRDATLSRMPSSA